MDDSSHYWVDINRAPGPYNGYGPWHLGRSGNHLFKDGHVATKSLEQWVTNDKGLWGP